MIFGDAYRTFDFDWQPVNYLQASVGGGVAYDRTPVEQSGDQTTPAVHAGFHAAGGGGAGGRAGCRHLRTR